MGNNIFFRGRMCIVFNVLFQFGIYLFDAAFWKGLSQRVYLRRCGESLCFFCGVIMFCCGRLLIDLICQRDYFFDKSFYSG